MSTIACQCTVHYMYSADEGDNAGNGDLDDDVVEALNDKENEIRSYLLHGEQLQEDTLESLVAPFWNQEPYKLVLHKQHTHVHVPLNLTAIHMFMYMYTILNIK